MLRTAVLGILTLAVVLIVQLADPAPMQRVQLLVFDNFQTLAPREIAQINRTAIVDIDDESIERIGQWPWPRTDLAILTDRLAEAGASVVVFDIVFSEPDRTSPEMVAKRLAPSTGMQSELARLPSHDSLLAESFGRVPVVTAFFLETDERGRNIEPKTGFTLSGTMPYGSVTQYEGSLQALPELEAQAAGNGFVSLQRDADGIVRRVPLVAIHHDTLVPSLSLETLRVLRDAGSPNLLTSDGSGETLDAPGAAVAMRIDGMEIPLNSAGETWVHFPQESKRVVLPAHTILADDFSPETLAEQVGGKIVFIGGGATGLQDLVATPQNASTPGVTVHAAITEQMLAGHYLERPDWAAGLEIVLMLFFGGMIALILPRVGAVNGALLAIGAIALVLVGTWLAFASLRFLINPIYPSLAIALIYTVQTVTEFYREEQERSYIHAAFDRYLSPELVNKIVKDPSKLELGGEERDMSVMMCDVRGFSRISEQYEPKQVIDFLIEFLTPMSDILMRRKATLDKYIGDAILAFWNAPLDDPDHHRNSARAALDMVEELKVLNRTMPNAKGVSWPGEVKIGIGLNSGICCVGNMGSKQRLNYSLIGDTVNIAARLEGLTKQYGVQIITGGSMMDKLAGFAQFELDQVRVVGRENAVSIFALLGDESEAASPRFVALKQAHSAMLNAYRKQDWSGAETVLKQAKDAYEAFDLPELRILFLDRIAMLRSNQPSFDWDGVFEATAK